MFLQSDAFLHRLAEVFLEVLGPDVRVFIDEVHEQVAEDLDVVGLIAQGVAEHLADARELVLAIERENHAEEAIELGAFHHLAEHEDVLGEGLFVGGVGEVDVAAQRAGVGDDEGVLGLDGGHVLEHRLALVRVESERGEHVNQAVRVDVFLMGVAAEHELEFRRGDHLADDVQDVVSHDALCGGEIADAHLDDPALDIADLIGAPLFDILLHGDVFGLPVVVLHRLVEIVGPLVFERQDVEEHRVPAVDDFLGGEGFLGLCLVEDEGAVSELDGGGGGHGGEVEFR